MNLDIETLGALTILVGAIGTTAVTIVNVTASRIEKLIILWKHPDLYEKLKG